MQKLVRDYLNELKRKQKKRKRVGTAVVLLVILVIGTVIGGLTQAGVAMTGNAKCGIEEHEHSDGCYEDVLACGQEEGEGHQHGEGCYTTETRLSCGMDETEGHQHDESCYDEAGNLICGTEEAAGHQHDDSCYTTEEVLTCEQEEGEGHIHSDACYEKELACKKEEHTHTEECYIDKKADVEDSSKWDEQYKDTEWKETWAENLVIAAEAQIGYKESEDNYEVAEDGSHKGYTRYGQFMDNVYADWDAAFVNFCMHYAGKDDINIEASEVFPKETEAVKWYEEFVGADEKNMSYLVAPQGYKPKAGELVFFDRKDEEPAFQMGIVSSYDEEKNEIKVIEGNSDNEVKENEYGIKDEDIEENHIFAYLKMDEVEEAYEASEKTVEIDADQKEDVNTEQPQEEIKELTTEVDGTTITLSGPVSSFEEGKEYSIQAEKVENKETIATIEEAIDQVAEEKGKKVENYQAFDIKLMVDGEEVQPLGPVEVKFSSKEVAKSVDDEATEVNVIHVDENTGEATDMEASTTEEKDVVIETEHFSVYVYVDLATLGGKVNLTIQHWANITYPDGADGEDGLTPSAPSDLVVGNAEAILSRKEEFARIYTDDELELDNQLKRKVEELSKLCIRNAETNTERTLKNYNLTEIWVLKEGRNPESKSRDDWYDYKSTDERIITLNSDNVIRMIYEPVEELEAMEQDVDFWDYNVTDGTVTTKGDKKYIRAKDKGINSPGNYDSASTVNNRVAIGMNNNNINHSYGADYAGYFKVENGVVTNIPRDKNRPRNYANYSGGVAKNIVKGVTDNGPIYNGYYDAGLFNDTVKTGKHSVKGYKLVFNRKGDSYTMTKVKNGSNDVLSGLDKFSEIYDQKSWNGKQKQIFSNNFWPMDQVPNYTGKDPMFGDNTKYYNENDEVLTNETDDKALHNYYFGMRYDFTFTLGDYVGPLKYYFRGDDDFWLFVDGELKTDIGGVHSSSGAMADLSYLMNQDKNKKHTLTVLYMERGGSGSTCYLEFTIPNVEPVHFETTVEKTDITINKIWRDHDNPNRPTAIKVQLQYKQNGSDQWSNYGNPVVLSGTAESNWSYTWRELPKEGYDYKVIEVVPPGYEATYSSGTYTDGTLAMETTGENAGKYTGTITNSLNPSTQLNIEKRWLDEDNAENTRPEKVDFQLLWRAGKDGKWAYYPGEGGRISLKAPEWKGTFENLPVYASSDTNTKMEYKVQEVNGDNQLLEEGGVLNVTNQYGTYEYIVSYNDRETGIGDANKITDAVITNTFKRNWDFKIIKQNKTGTSNLEGATFKLTPTSPSGNSVYTGETDKNGVIKWKKADSLETTVETKDIEFGTYKLEEVTAPMGYVLSNEKWILDIKITGITVKKEDGSMIQPTESAEGSMQIYSYVFINEVLYELPSTGGFGIYWYMFGGVLLMAGAMLMTYRNKRREVLRS